MNQKSPTTEKSRNHWLGLFTPDIIGILSSGYTTARLRDDVFGGLTAAVVALPLALAFGVASGAGPIAGLYGAIACGFFAAIFGGTHAQVSGPTGPMTVVMGAIIASHAGNLAEAFTIVILGGVIQMAFGFMRVGRYIVYTPYSVVSGFMTGIGAIIMIIQILPFFGMPTSTGGVIGTITTLIDLDISSIDWRAFYLATASLLLIIFWPEKLQKILPAPLAALIAGTLAAVYLVTGLPEIGEVPSSLPSFITPQITMSGLPNLLQAAFVLALLGAIDSLLTSLVADSVTRTRHNSDKELIGQGLGNIFAGFIGALPGAGATMRTIVNVRAGGRTPVSGALHAIVLLTMALGLGPIVSSVPHAVLAAILMKVGWDIIDWGYLKRMRSAPRDKFIIMLITFALTVFVDLITAVAVGIILASFVSARWIGEEQLKGLKQSADAEELDLLSEEERVLLRQADGKVLVSMLEGTFSYASARELTRFSTPDEAAHQVIIYDFSHTGYVDTSAALAIEEMIAQSEAKSQYIIITGLQGQALQTLDGLNVLRTIPESQRITDRMQAIKAAVAHVKDDVS